MKFQSQPRVGAVVKVPWLPIAAAASAAVIVSAVVFKPWQQSSENGYGAGVLVVALVAAQLLYARFKSKK